jgi:1-acylglycerone phosphate reductase
MKELSVAGVEILQLDPTNAASILSARDHISKRTGGKLDILINNAGQCILSSLPSPYISLFQL